MLQTDKAIPLRYTAGMEHILDWPPPALLQSPLFFPLRLAMARLDTQKFPDLQDWNRALALQAEIILHSGKPLRFVAQEQGRLGFESQYEPRCYLQGEVQTRANNWHDGLNALVWLTFPRAKAAINFRHYLALQEQAVAHRSDRAGSQRGRVRDAVTLLDESGVIVVSADRELSGLLQAFEWKELFWNRREHLCHSMDFFVFGHGLYEKAMQPYIGMTGQGLLLYVEPVFFTMPLAERLQCVDREVAAFVNNRGRCLNPRELHPVPLLGVPGWSAESSREEFYDNQSYFRPGRRQDKK